MTRHSARERILRIQSYDESKFEHGKKIGPLLHELGATNTDLARAHDIILTLLSLI